MTAEQPFRVSEKSTAHDIFTSPQSFSAAQEPFGHVSEDASDDQRPLLTFPPSLELFTFFLRARGMETPTRTD